MDLVLMLRDDERSPQLGPSLWAAFAEVEKFFGGVGHLDAEFRRFYLARTVPPGVVADGREGAGEDAGERERKVKESLDDQVFWDEAQGKLIDTYRVEPLVKLARELVGIAGSDTRMVLVTDQELTPDPQLLPGTVRQPKQPSMVQYMFFANYLDSNRIISIKTLDPLTWGQEVERRPRDRQAPGPGALLPERRAVAGIQFLSDSVLLPAGLLAVAGLAGSDGLCLRPAHPPGRCPRK